MMALVQEKEKAIILRKKGLSYKEILKEVPVAKSSLSLWLSDLPLTRDEKRILRKRKNANITKGRAKAALANKNRRLEREALWFGEAVKVFKKHCNEPLFHVGVSLYWAEGGKRVSQWCFSNSDHEMIEVLATWLEKYCDIDRKELFFRLYIHKPYAQENLEAWWKTTLKVKSEQFVKTIYKPASLGVKKRPNYKGCLKIEVRKSKHLLCKMKFWQKMLVEHYKKR